MENKRPLILVSNDDGIMAKGISELIKFLRPLGEIVVMAPDAPRSGSGCALTVTQPVHYQLLKKDVGLTVYKCSGTPTDCIKLARNQILDRKPDLLDQMGLYHQFLPQAVRPLRDDMKLAGYAMTVLMIDVFGQQKKPFGYLTEALDDLQEDEI